VPGRFPHCCAFLEAIKTLTRRFMSAAFSADTVDGPEAIRLAGLSGNLCLEGQESNALADVSSLRWLVLFGILVERFCQSFGLEISALSCTAMVCWALARHPLLV
jgi:hypothetical protein